LLLSLRGLSLFFPPDRFNPVFRFVHPGFVVSDLGDQTLDLVILEEFLFALGMKFLSQDTQWGKHLLDVTLN
jgi:hypothetical protein